MPTEKSPTVDAARDAQPARDVEGGVRLPHEARVTEGDVKEIVQRYCEENFPGWECAAVSVRVGPVRAAMSETLLVLPPTLPATLSDRTLTTS